MTLNDITARDLVIALRAAWSLCVFWILVRTRDVRALEARIRAGSREARPAAARIAPARLVGIVRRVARVHPLRPRCLEQALTAALLADRAGLSTSVRIGVRRGPSGVDAHAWVVISGVIMDPSASGFTPLLSLHGGLRDRFLAISS